MRRTLAIARKEWMHILRDPRSLIILFLMPLMMVFLYGYAITMDVKNISLGIWDGDNTPQSRDLIRDVVHSGYFTEKVHLASCDAVDDAIQKRQVNAVLSIPNGYGKDSINGTPPPVGVWEDGSDANTASVIQSYIRAIMASRSMPSKSSAAAPFDIRQKVFYNPELKSSHFIVPGLVAVLMMMICAMLTSMAIVREKETGTFEQLLVSPILAWELIIGKVLPYLILSFLVAAFILAVGYLHFGVPFQGSILLLAVFLLIYLFCALSLGLLVSTIVDSQRLAMLIALLTTLLPSVILSGFIFPIRSMPPVIQIITYIVPAKYFLTILRGIMLKDCGLGILWSQSLVLLGMGIVLVIVSVVRFHKTMVKV
ncbi:hypothetical protein AMJ86_07370 [bacterium SM23_57]|nr:MAG: hypothetical protein AMJ86_07370 [bacterium SM23_57]